VKNVFTVFLYECCNFDLILFVLPLLLDWNFWQQQQQHQLKEATQSFVDQHTHTHTYTLNLNKIKKLFYAVIDIN